MSTFRRRLRCHVSARVSVGLGASSCDCVQLGNFLTQTPKEIYAPMAYSRAARTVPLDRQSGNFQQVRCATGAPWTILRNAEFFFIKQKVDMLEAMTGFEEANTYYVFDDQGDQCFVVEESSNMCSRQCLKNRRPFVLTVRHVVNNKPVLRISREWKCMMQCIKVYDQRDATLGEEENENNLLGFVEQDWTFFSRSFKVLNRQRQPLLNIDSNPFWSPYTFTITTNTGAACGEIKKQWSGLAQEIFTDADNFGFSFLKDLSESTKALLLSAVFLIDFMYFEDNEPVNQRRGGRGGGGGRSRRRCY